jgi:hypothetical protein
MKRAPKKGTAEPVTLFLPEKKGIIMNFVSLSSAINKSRNSLLSVTVIFRISKGNTYYKHK